jgi:hypothetical protein
MASSIRKDMAEIYDIRADGEWATIALVCCEKSSVSNHWGGEILIHSSFGCFNHGWLACGKPFKEFLIGIKFDYFMKKCLGAKFYVFDGEETFKVAVSRVLEARRAKELWKTDARSMYDDLYERKDDLVVSADQFMLNTELVTDRPAQWRVFEEAYDMIQRKPDQQAQAFWEKLWPLFENQLRTEVGQVCN